jgi:hypothetical protein
MQGGLRGMFASLAPVFEKEDLAGFGISILGGRAFEAALTDPACEACREQGGWNDEGDGSVEDIDIICHGDSSNT